MFSELLNLFQSNFVWCIIMSQGINYHVKSLHCITVVKVKVTERVWILRKRLSHVF